MICIFSIFAALVAGAADPSAATQTNQMAEHLKLNKTRTVELKYLLFLPKGYDSKGTKKWPLMLFLHGAGERGTDVWKVAVHGPPKQVMSNPDFPFILVSPQCPDDRIWSNDDLLVLLDEMMRNYSVDESRVYLTGLSMGGMEPGAWGWRIRRSSQQSRRFAAAEI